MGSKFNVPSFSCTALSFFRAATGGKAADTQGFAATASTHHFPPEKINPTPQKT